MASVRTTTTDTTQAGVPARPRASWGDDLAAALLGTWVVGGLFLDGWAHVNQPGLETFFSPWHGVFYLGFLVSTVVLARLVSLHQCGRFDPGPHPFCTMIGTGDVRIASRYQLRNFPNGFLGVMHETGHALYEQGLDPAHYGTPMGEAVSLGIHESQSRMWENFVGRSRGFWSHFYPQLQDAFNDQLRGVSLDAFRGTMNVVAPGFIRVEADEVTYNLHIVIRFELERALLDGTIRSAELPAAWRDLYQKYLGITPENDRVGCLQDIHWSEALIGYFPTYTLGNVYAAQLFEAAERAIGPLEDAFAAGEFRTLREWLGENIHRHGKRYVAAQLVERVTGSAPDPSALIANLSRRYA